MHPTLVLITGPTAVGKTTLCVKVAQHFNTEIISADARQCYKELNIGTAKPTPTEQKEIIHHFVDSHSIIENYNANDFEKDALELLNRLFKKQKIVIVTGGSGLYIDALCNGFDNELPEGNEQIRKELVHLHKKYGITILQQKLKQLDPDFYNQVDLFNFKKLQRAIEVCMVSGKTYSSLRKGNKQKRPFHIIKIGLKRNRKELFNRIDQRVDNMMQAGLLEEVKSVIPYQQNNALKTVGYSELFDHLQNRSTLDQAIEKIKINTRRYAKRQIAWFNRNNEYNWFHPDQLNEIILYIKNECIFSESFTKLHYRQSELNSDSP